MLHSLGHSVFEYDDDTLVFTFPGDNSHIPPDKSVSTWVIRINKYVNRKDYTDSLTVMRTRVMPRDSILFDFTGDDAAVTVGNLQDVVHAIQTGRNWYGY